MDVTSSTEHEKLKDNWNDSGSEEAGTQKKEATCHKEIEQALRAKGVAEAGDRVETASALAVVSGFLTRRGGPALRRNALSAGRQ